MTLRSLRNFHYIIAYKKKKEKKRGLINENDLIKRLYKHALKKCIFKNATLREESKCILNLTKIDDKINNLLEQFGRHIL